MENLWSVEELRELLEARGCGVVGEVKDKKRLRAMAKCVVGKAEFAQIEDEKRHVSPIDPFDGVARGLPTARVAPPGGQTYEDVFGMKWRAVDNPRTRMLEWHLVM